MRKRRKNAVIIIISLIISSTFGIFALNIRKASSTETDYAFQPNHYSTDTKYKPDSLKRTTQSRTYYNIKTEMDTPLIELNTADTLDLQALKGVGPAYARWIWRYRMALGGFRSIEQLKEVKNMTVELYHTLLPQITLDTSLIRKININTADFSTLNNHPYIDYYLAKAIINYRQREGLFQSLDDLKAIYILEYSTFNKIQPYLDV
ncbi:MAG: helix-hairpin-helix domain-containing protein [Bacteroidales bacterium]|jgi:DNA uptake protein ComE-like DNA-binding protein|nr:helix-hairpin-helix domain-containing protein [Bacteroidales bacterium]